MVKAITPKIPAAAEAAAAPTFEAALAELEALVDKMEQGSAPLDESLAAYERGVQLLKQCQETLAAAEQKLHILEGGVLRDFNEDGGSRGAALG